MGDRKTMSRKKMAGQTVIETVLMLLFLLMIFFLIAEFARAWYLKNSLNNAVRVAVRAAIVDSDLALVSDDPCPSGNAIANIVCGSPGIANTSATVVSVQSTDNDSSGDITSGDTITVTAEADFVALIPFIENLLPKKAASEATMRHE